MGRIATTQLGPAARADRGGRLSPAAAHRWPPRPVGEGRPHRPGGDYLAVGGRELDGGWEDAASGVPATAQCR
jgi:hypothetical protein